MSCCGKIGDVLSSVLNAIKPLLTVALLCFAAYALLWVAPGATIAWLEGISWLPAAITGATASTLGYIALGATLLLDPEAVVDIAKGIASTVGKVAGAVVAGVTTGLLSGLSSSTLLGYAALALAAYFLFFKNKEDRDVVVKTNDNEATPTDPGKTTLLKMSSPTDETVVSSPVDRSQPTSDEDEGMIYV